MTEHKATPEHWPGIERFAKDGHYDSCLLELRARVEALEAAQRVESNAPESSDSLVEQVADGIYRNGTGDGFREEARAAIHAIADWLDQQELHIAATRLRQEVG